MKDRHWLATYAEYGIPVDIDPNAHHSVVHMLEGAMKAHADKPAFRSFGQTLTYADVDRQSRNFAAYLQNKLGDRERDMQELRRSAFRAAWKKDLPFVSKDRMLVLGPHVDTARCAAVDPGVDPSCASSWLEWAAHASPLPDG